MKSENYYGSDLNKFIDERCSREMTCMNIDCFLVKVSKKEIRFIESKHEFENMGKGQKTGLRILTGLVHSDFVVGSYLVRGEYPYETGATITDLSNGNLFKVDQDDLIAWLNFEFSLEA